jgi:CDP-4-dehydro-6-deoxyglucose reductase
MTPPLWKKGIVTDIRDIAPETKRYFISIPALEVFDFVPGQFVTLDLPIGERNAERWRSYSIASAPDGTNQFELVIVKAKEGKGTDYIFSDLSIGSAVDVRGPQGKFTLPVNLDKDLFLICTGTGIAPFRSMIKHIYEKQIPHQNIYLIFGCRYQKDLLYADEFFALANQENSFHYHPTLSRETWDGHQGYVHAVYTPLLAQHPQASFYLCGWKDMINQARENIMALGYARNDIHFELYG